MAPQAREMQLGWVGRTIDDTGEAGRRPCPSFSTGSAGHQLGRAFAGPELHGWVPDLPTSWAEGSGPGGHLRSGGFSRSGARTPAYPLLSSC